jgi:DNA-binding NtrC family response regulator
VEDAGGGLDRLLDRMESLDSLEGELLEAAVTRSDGNLSAAARTLGITRPQLAYRLKKHRAQT